MTSRGTFCRGLRGDRGFLTIWMLGLCVILLALGGLSVDLWHVFDQRQSLAGDADAAAVAGASGIDTTLAYRGTIALDKTTATELARQSLAAQPGAASLISSPPVITFNDPADTQITVSVTGSTRPFLLSLLGVGSLTFHASSTATALRSP